MGEARKQTKEFAATVGGVLKELSRRQQEYNSDLLKTVEILNKFNVGNVNATVVLQAMKRAVDEIIDRKNKLRDTETGLRVVTDATTASQKALEQELKNLKKEYDNLDKSNANYRQELDRINKRLAEVIPNVHRFSEVVRVTKKNLDATSGSYKQMSLELTQLKNRLQAMPGAFNATTGAINRQNKEAVALQHKIETLDKALKRADSSMGAYGRSVGNYRSAFSGLGAQILGIAGPLAIVTTLLAGFNKVINANIEFQNMEAGLRAVVDTEQELAETIEFLRGIANKYGQDLNNLAISYKSLTAASKGTSLEGAQTRKIFEAVVQAGTALKLSNVQVESSLRAIQQMLSKGKVSAEELRQQLGEHLPGAFNIFAQAAGVSTAKLDKMLRSGEVLASDILPKVADILNKTYSKSAIENAQQLTNETNRLTNSFNRFLQSFGQKSGMVSFWTEVKRGMASFFDSLNVFTNSPSWKSFIGIFNGSNTRANVQAQLKEQDFNNFQSQTSSQRRETLTDKRAAVTVARNIADNSTGAKNVQDEKDYAEALRIYKQYLGRHLVLDNEEAHNAQKHNAEMKALGEANKKDSKDSAEEKLRERIAANRKAQDLLKAEAELDIKLAEDKSVDKIITEKEFQEQKYWLTVTYLEKSIEKELELGKHADQERITNLKKEIIEAEVEISKFLEKNRERGPVDKLSSRSTKISDRGVVDAGGAADRVVEATVDAEARKMEIERNRRDVSYREEMEYLEKIKRLYVGNTEAIQEIEHEQALLTARHRRETIDLIADYAQQASDQLFSTLADNQQIASDNRIRQLENARNKELEIAGSNAAAREKIEKEYQKRINAEKTKQAKREKTMALFEIAINTAIGVIKAVAASPLTFGLPWSAYALAQGAFQAALVASRPLPKFAKGTKSAPVGKALVGEAGFELIERNGRMYVAREPQIMDMKGGERVWTHEESKRIIDHALRAENNIADKATSALTRQISDGKQKEAVNNLVRAFDRKGISKDEMRGIMKDTVGNITVERNSWDEKGYRRSQENKNGLNTYLNKRHSFN
jgi:tape measure domain-containing protein